MGPKPRLTAGSQGSSQNQGSILQEIRSLREENRQQYAGLNQAITAARDELQTIKEDFTARTDQLARQVENQQQIIDILCDETRALRNAIEEQEWRDKRNNILISGLPEDHEETWAEAEAHARALLHDQLGLHSDKMVVQRAHRVGRYYENAQTPRKLVMRFAFYKDKELVLRKIYAAKPGQAQRDECLHR